MVPEVRNGYFWLAKDATGLGTTSFRVPEGNKHPTFDLVQATVASQPTALTENGGAQFRMRKVADSNPSIISTAGSVQARWTGNTCLFGWFRLPDASGATTGPGNLFVHTPTTAGQRRFALSPVLSSGSKITTSASNDGTATTANTWVSPFVNSGWIWIANIIIPGTSVELSSNFTQLSHTVTNAPVSPLFDGSSAISIGCRAAAGLANTDTTDWATCYYTNGIPSLKNIVRIANYLNPLNIKF